MRLADHIVPNQASPGTPFGTCTAHLRLLLRALALNVSSDGPQQGRDGETGCMTSLSSAMTRNNAIPTLRRAAEHPSHVRCTPSRPQPPIGIRNTDNCRELHANCLDERMRADDVACPPSLAQPDRHGGAQLLHHAIGRGPATLGRSSSVGRCARIAPSSTRHYCIWQSAPSESSTWWHEGPDDVYDRQLWAVLAALGVGPASTLVFADDVFCADATLPARQPTKPSDGGHPLPRVPQGSRPGTAGQAVGVAQRYAWARIGGVAALRPSTHSRRWWGASVNGSPAASQTLFSAP